MTGDYNPNSGPGPPTTSDPHSLAEAALANNDIRSYLSDPQLGRIWTEEAIRRCPTCRNEWEYATVIATTGEARSADRHKNWGRFLGVFPLAPEDPRQQLGRTSGWYLVRA